MISVALSLLLVVKHTTTTRIILLGQSTTIDDKTKQVTLKYKNLREKGVSRVENGLIVRFEEGLFFGNVGQLQERLKRIEMHGDLGIHPGEEPIFNDDHDMVGGWDDQIQVVHHSVFRIKFVVFDMKAVSEMDAR